MRLDDFLREVQAQAGAVDLVLQGAAAAKERLEDVRLLVGGNSRSAIGHADFDGRFGIAAGSGCRDADPMAIAGAVFGRVVEQVLQRLFERHGVAHDDGQVPVDVRLQGATGLLDDRAGPIRPSLRGCGRWRAARDSE